MFAETYGKDNHYLFKAASLHNLSQTTILEMVNCSSFNWSLEDDPAILKSILTVLNSCGLPTNQADYWQCVNIHTMLVTLHREDQLGKHFEHSRPKTIDFFIWGRQNTLGDFNALLENLYVACVLIVILQLK